MSQSLNQAIELDKLKLEDRRRVLRNFPNATVKQIETGLLAFVDYNVADHPKAKLEVSFSNLRYIARLVVDIGLSKADPSKHLKIYSEGLCALSHNQIVDLINSTTTKNTFEYVIKLIKSSKSEMKVF